MKPLFGFATLFFLVAVTAAPAVAAPMRAPDAPAAAAPMASAHMLGKPDAPITVNEYVSLTCPHCATFYNDVLPELEKQYVDTGKVKFVLHEFARDAVDLKGFTVARCMPDEQYFPFISVLFKNQMNWIMAPNPERILTQYAQLGGLSAEKVKACLADTKMQDAIAAEVKQDQDQLSIQSTPTFIIDPGADRVEGAKSAQEFAAMFDRLLTPKK